MITLFENITSTTKPFFRDVEFVLNRIKNGNSSELISKVRVESDKDKRNILKQQLPCVCFSGEFNVRNLSGLRKHSGFICLDFDDVDGEDYRERMKKDKYIYAAWLSPSKGVKCLIKIPTNDHAASFRALKKRYTEIDRSCKDVTRVCYESYDADLWVNESSETFATQIEEVFEVTTIENPQTDDNKVYEGLKKWLDKKGESFYEGNRNNFLARLVSACNRFGISKETTRDLVAYDFVNGQTSFHISEFDNIIRSIYNNYSHQFGTAQMESGNIVESVTKKEIVSEIIDFSLPSKDVIKAKDIIEEIRDAFNNGIGEGQSTYFRLIDNHFRFERGEVTGIGGLANHGKSSFMMQLLMHRAYFNGEKFTIFSPESIPPTDWFLKLMWMYTGETYKKGNYQMSESVFNEALDFVHEHFFYLYPKDNEHTPKYINERFAESIKKDKVDGVMIDPFNQMHHNTKMRDDQYIGDLLAKAKRFALANNVYYFIVAHSNGSVTTDEQGNYKLPYILNLNGGAIWSAKLDNFFVIHRPKYKTHPEDPSAIFSSQKIKKQDRNGKPGIVDLTFNWKTNRFSEVSDEGDIYNPLDNGLGNYKKQEVEF